jgi:hypothetical protein
VTQVGVDRDDRVVGRGSREIDRYLHVRRFPQVERRDLVDELLRRDATKLVAAVSEPQVLLPRKVIERSASGVGLVLIDDAEAIAGREADRRREGRQLRRRSRDPD